MRASTFGPLIAFTVAAAGWTACTPDSPAPRAAVVDACARFDQTMRLIRDGDFDYGELQEAVDEIDALAARIDDEALRNAADEMVARIDERRASDFIDRAQLFGRRCEQLGAGE